MSIIIYTVHCDYKLLAYPRLHYSTLWGGVDYGVGALWGGVHYFECAEVDVDLELFIFGRRSDWLRFLIGVNWWFFRCLHHGGITLLRVGLGYSGSGWITPGRAGLLRYGSRETTSHG